MKRPNPELYPISAKLVADVIASGFAEIIAVQSIVEAVGEYEHGSVDVEDVNPDAPVDLEQYAAVAFDLILMIGGRGEERLRLLPQPAAAVEEDDDLRCDYCRSIDWHRPGLDGRPDRSTCRHTGM